MSDELLTPEVSAEGQEPDAQDEKTVSELQRARREAAKYRTEAAELKKWREQVEPTLAQFQKQQEAQKTDAQKAQERAADLERQLAERDSAIARVQREAAAVRLATKAGVDPDLVSLIDLSKIDFEDEEAAVKVLSKFAAARVAASASNPGRAGPAAPSDDELRGLYFGRAGNKPTIFGG